MKTLKDILSPKFSTAQRNQRRKTTKSSFDFIHLIENWNQVAGEHIAKNTSPLKIQNGRLVLLVRNASYTTHLTFFADTLLQKIHQKFPEIKKLCHKITFQVNTQFFENKNVQNISQQRDEIKRKNKFNKFNPEYIKIKKQAEIEFNEVDDQDMKNSLIEIFIQLHHQ